MGQSHGHGHEIRSPPDNVNQVQATLYRFEALQEAIQVEVAKGQKAHTWLSPMEVKRLMSLPRLEKPIGRRDKITLGLCMAAGLRREEAVSLCFDDIALLAAGGQDAHRAKRKGERRQR